jgi:TetR/AcrR family transcriptional regulator, transcriptional repressor for nem operon
MTHTSEDALKEPPPDTGGRTMDTRSRILDIGERLIQIRGFNGFSYADVAGELSITKASLHYHFPSKADLGEAIIARYAQNFARALDAIGARQSNAPAKLSAYANLYADVLREQRMCLCGMLASEYESIVDPMRHAVIDFLDDNETWLVTVLEQGRSEGDLSFAGSAACTARSIVSGLEGAMLIARPYRAVERFEAAATQLLAGLTGA